MTSAGPDFQQCHRMTELKQKDSDLTSLQHDFNFDFFVIGAGSGGVRASRIAAALGARVGVAEERYFGGTCVNVGCVPKKLLSYAAHFADDFRDSAGFGWDVASTRFDWPTLIQNKDHEINRLNSIYQSLLDNAGVTIYQQRAVLKDGHAIQIGEQLVTAQHILIAVGGWPWVPSYPGSEHAISSNEIFALPKLPESIVIQGGGYIAVEFASIFARLGSKTTLVYRGDSLLRGFDDDVRQFITASMQEDLNLRLQDDISKIDKNNKGLLVTFDSGDQLEAEVVLAATGRRPLTANLGLDAANVATDSNGAIVVNEQFQTSNPGIYAVGDVIDRVALTPVALAEGEFVARALFSGQPREMSYENIATAVFCHPNIGTVGLSEAAARQAGYDVVVYADATRPLKHTLSGSNEKAFIKLVVDRSSDKVLGVHVVAQDAGELIQGFAVAMRCGARKADFDATIGIHPTLAEELVTMRNARE